MPYSVDDKLVIAVASSALFNLDESDAIFKEQGVEAYRNYQLQNIDNPLPKGVAFPFIKRFLSLNTSFPDIEPVEVILLSRNNTETGLRIMRSIEHYNLSISRAAFLTGKSPYSYIPAYNASLFLSANTDDVRAAVNAGYPAGTVLHSTLVDDENDKELRIAFDFDGVIVDDQAEKVFQKTHDIEAFHKLETSQAQIPHNPGPLQGLFKKISFFQQLERQKELNDKEYKRILRTAIITARNAPSHERVINTLRKWGVDADETFFLGGIEKRRILEIMKPHIFFDDQMAHLKPASDFVPSVHIPFGVTNV